MGSVKLGAGSILRMSGVSDDVKERLIINCGKNCIIDIDGIDVINGRLGILLGDGAVLRIGSGQRVNGHVNIMMHEASLIEIGADCLWGDCRIWSSDMHSIIDRASNSRINLAEDISIGSNVWFGFECMILKGARVGSGCVVGARAVVTKSTEFAPNSLLVGLPARVVKSNISWDERLL